MTPGLLGFALGWAGSMPLCGPVSLFVFRRGAIGRSRDGILLAVGAALAEAGCCAAALFGIGFVVDRWPWLRPAAGVVGALIMVGLGVHFLMTRRSPAHVAAPERPLPNSWARDLTLGFSMVALNPSVLLSWLAVLAALHAMGLDIDGGPQRLVFVTGVAAGITGWFSLLIWLLHHGRALIRPVVLDRLLRVLGGVLCAVGLGVLISSLR